MGVEIATLENLFGRVNQNYETGFVPAYTGKPLVFEDRIIFQLPGYFVQGTTSKAESYLKKVTVQPNQTYTLSFTLKGASSIKIVVADANFNNTYSAWDSKGIAIFINVATSSATFTPTCQNIYIEFLNINNQPPFELCDIKLYPQGASEPQGNRVISKATINDELFGFAGVFDEYKNGKLYKRWKRITTTTDSSGNVSLSGYWNGTKAIAVNNATGDVRVLDAASTLATGWVSTEIDIIFVMKTPEVVNLNFDGELYGDAGINYVTISDFGLIKVSGAQKYLEG